MVENIYFVALREALLLPMLLCENTSCVAKNAFNLLSNIFLFGDKSRVVFLVCEFVTNSYMYLNFLC